MVSPGKFRVCSRIYEKTKRLTRLNDTETTFKETMRIDPKMFRIVKCFACEFAKNVIKAS